MGSGNINALGGLKGIDFSRLTEGMKLDSPLGKTLRGLLRYGGTPLLQDLMMPEYQAQQMAPSPFRLGGF